MLTAARTIGEMGTFASFCNQSHLEMCSVIKSPICSSLLSKSRAPVSQVTAQNTATLLTAARNWHALLGPFSGDELLCFVQLGTDLHNTHATDVQ